MKSRRMFSHPPTRLVNPSMVTIEADGKEYSGEQLWREEAVLRELYINRNLSTLKIADELGCNKSTVMDWMGCHNIETRSRREALVLAELRNPASYQTSTLGYEEWRTKHRGEDYHVYVHRLLAVAEYGFETVEGMDVHHKNGIPWGNWPSNIELMDVAEHRSHHAQKLWQDEDHRERIREAMEDWWDDDERLEARSERSKKMWAENEEYRRMMEQSADERP